MRNHRHRTVPASRAESAAAGGRWQRRGPLGRLVRLEPDAARSLERDYRRAA